MVGLRVRAMGAAVRAALLGLGEAQRAGVALPSRVPLVQPPHSRHFPDVSGKCWGQTATLWATGRTMGAIADCR